MSDDLFVGMTIYHRTNKIKAEIKRLDEENITVELCSKIQEKSILELPITHIGEWLFFDKADIELPAETLEKNPQYLKYNNEKLLKAHNKYLEQQAEIEDEKERKLIAIEKQKEREKEERIKAEKSERERIQLNMELIDFLKKQEYSFEGFYHYTDFTNFINIMQTGKLLCRSEAERIGFVDAAEQSVIEQTHKSVKDSVRFFFKEKTPTIYRNEGIKTDNASPHMPIPVILLFNEDIINHSDVAFSDGCGGSKHSKITKEIQVATRFDWATIFSRGFIPEDDDSDDDYGPHSKKEIKRKRNAEFLYEKEIDIKHLKKIIFRCPADLKHAVELFGTNKLFKIGQSKYNNERNYLYDYDFEYKQNYFKVALKFRLENYNLYSHEILIIHEDGFEESIDIAKPNNRIIESVKPKGYEDYSYYFDCLTDKNRVVVKIEYKMNDHICAIWEVNKSDKVL